MKKKIAFMLLAIFSLLVAFPCFTVSAQPIPSTKEQKFSIYPQLTPEQKEDAKRIVEELAAEFLSEHKEEIEMYKNSPKPISNSTPVISEETRTYAYMDLDKADAMTKEKILEARDEIANQTDWYADNRGVIGFTLNLETGEVEETPAFSELFPGWDLPIIDLDENN